MRFSVIVHYFINIMRRILNIGSLQTPICSVGQFRVYNVSSGRLTGLKRLGHEMFCYDPEVMSLNLRQVENKVRGSCV